MMVSFLRPLTIEAGFGAGAELAERHQKGLLQMPGVPLPLFADVQQHGLLLLQILLHRLQRILGVFGGQSGRGQDDDKQHENELG